MDNQLVIDPVQIIAELENLQNSAKESGDLSSLLKKLEVKASDEIPPPESAMVQVVEDKERIFCTLGNISLVIGKAKSRKSFFINISLVAALSSGNSKLALNLFKGTLPHDKRMVLYFDTEQGKYHVQLALKRICKQLSIDIPKNLIFYGLRSEETSIRLALIEFAIYNTPNLGFVVIDGIRDLVTSINDEEQATMLTSKLMKWSEEKNIHIMTVLHQNKSDNNARGHLGTEMINKSETVISITKSDQDKDISTVEAQESKNIPIESFAFEIIDGIPEVVENFEFRTTSNKKRFDPIENIEDHKKRECLNAIFSKNSEMGYSNLWKTYKIELKKRFSITVSDNDVKTLITYFHCDKKWILQEKPRGKYILNRDAY